MEKTIRIKSIKTSIFLWITGVLLSFTITVVFLVISTNALETMTERVYMDAKSLEISYRLKAAVLGERRESLQLKITNDNSHLIKRNEELKEAHILIDELPKYSTSLEEEKIIDELKKRLKKFSTAVQSETFDSDAEEMARLTDNLLQAVEKHREVNNAQMQLTLEKSNGLNRISNLWSIVVAVSVFFIIVIGTMLLIKKILIPTYAVSDAARSYGEGDFSKRTGITQMDELGILCKTFNEMADNIERLNRNRVEFIASVAHDLKNPLALIGAASYLLKKKSVSPDERILWLDRIIQQVQHLEKMILDLMDMTQIETGELNLNKTEIELNSFINEIREMHDDLITTHSIEFEHGAECWIPGDRKWLERVISNLISNAVKYSPDNLKILIKLTNDNSRAIITVQDYGIGIAPDDIPKLFLPFERLGHSQNRIKGTGIGLYSSKKIIDMHGGTIDIESEPCQGTTVYVTLPFYIK